MTLTDIIQNRRSVRAFTEKIPSAALIENLMRTAARAPSAGNLQPWRAVALAGEPLKTLVADAQSTPEVAPRHAAYPDPLWEPYRSRRFENGEQLYATLGIPREDKAARAAAVARNATLFDAPVGIFLFTDRRVGAVQWMDMGIYAQTLMLLAAEQGLASCAQGYWRRHDALVRRHCPEIPENYEVVCAIAVGYEDATAPINAMRATRADFGQWGHVRGF